VNKRDVEWKFFLAKLKVKIVFIILAFGIALTLYFRSGYYSDVGIILILFSLLSLVKMIKDVTRKKEN
jgi:hypothetical protein